MENRYQDILQKAMHAQRNGNVTQYSILNEEAKEILQIIEQVKQRTEKNVS